MALTTMYWNLVRNSYNYNMEVVQEEDGIQFWSIWALLTLTFALSSPFIAFRPLRGYPGC